MLNDPEDIPRALDTLLKELLPRVKRCKRVRSTEWALLPQAVEQVTALGDPTRGKSVWRCEEQMIFAWTRRVCLPTPIRPALGELEGLPDFFVLLVLRQI